MSYMYFYLRFALAFSLSMAFRSFSNDCALNKSLKSRRKLLFWCSYKSVHSNICYNRFLVRAWASITCHACLSWAIFHQFHTLSVFKSCSKLSNHLILGQLYHQRWALVGTYRLLNFFLSTKYRKGHIPSREFF